MCTRVLLTVAHAKRLAVETVDRLLRVLDPAAEVADLWLLEADGNVDSDWQVDWQSSDVAVDQTTCGDANTDSRRYSNVES